MIVQWRLRWPVQIRLTGCLWLAALLRGNVLQGETTMLYSLQAWTLLSVGELLRVTSSLCSLPGLCRYLCWLSPGWVDLSRLDLVELSATLSCLVPLLVSCRHGHCHCLVLLPGVLFLTVCSSLY